MEGKLVKVRGNEHFICHIKAAEPSSEGRQAFRPTVFFIHGYGGASSQWEGQLRELSGRGYEVVAFDILGHGKSVRPEDEDAYATSELVADAVDIITRYQGRRNILIGHSYGAALCVHLANKAPNVMSMALIGMCVESPIPTTLLSVIPSFAFDGIRFVMGLGGDRSMAVDKMLHTSASGELRQRQQQLGSRNSSFVLQATGARATWPRKADFEAVVCPVLMVHGREDQVTTVANAQLLRKWLANLHDWVVLDNAGHNVMLELPDQVSSSLLSFISDMEHAEELHETTPVASNSSVAALGPIGSLTMLNSTSLLSTTPVLSGSVSSL